MSVEAGIRRQSSAARVGEIAHPETIAHGLKQRVGVHRDLSTSQENRPNSAQEMHIWSGESGKVSGRKGPSEPVYKPPNLRKIKSSSRLPLARVLISCILHYAWIVTLRIHEMALLS